MKVILAKDVNVNKLTDEMIEKNLTPHSVSSDLKNSDVIGNATFNFESDIDILAVQKIIDNHDSKPIKQVTIEEVLKAKIETETINLLLELGVI